MTLSSSLGDGRAVTEVHDLGFERFQAADRLDGSCLQLGDRIDVRTAGNFGLELIAVQDDLAPDHHPSIGRFDEH